MKRMPNKWFIIALLIPVIILFGMLVKPIQTKLIGEEVWLGTIPIDPRDLFRGDYVILDLEIERVHTDLLEPTLYEKIKENYSGKYLTVFVSLEEGEDGVYQVKQVSDRRPDDLYLKASMDPYIYDNNWRREDSMENPYVEIDYGIDRFYVEEGTGLELEELARQGKVIVKAKIHNGYSVLTEIKGLND